jgi:hypothetical protein
MNHFLEQIISPAALFLHSCDVGPDANFQKFSKTKKVLNKPTLT